MRAIHGFLGLSALTVFLLLPASAQDQSMSFFVTSDGPGRGADLGGLAGADAHCQTLADQVDAGDREWRAYLSTQGRNAVNARDRIGQGPWHNAQGALVGRDLKELHSHLTRVGARTAITEEGDTVPGSGYHPNRHDILTGSQPDGTAFPPGDDKTCQNWTSSSDDHKARIGHHDRAAWNSAHDTRGCSMPALESSGGAGLFYCFAAD